MAPSTPDSTRLYDPEYITNKGVLYDPLYYAEEDDTCRPYQQRELQDDEHSYLDPESPIDPESRDQFPFPNTACVPEEVHINNEVTSSIPNKKEAAKRIVKGDRFIRVPEGTYDRTPVKVDNPEPSKLSATFLTERDDPKNPSQTISGTPVTYTYPNPVDWSDQKSVTKLNCFRRNMFANALGVVQRDFRKWMMEENEYLLDLLEIHLETPGIDGRFSCIDWNIVAKRFNVHFDGHVFRHGDEFAALKLTSRNDGVLNCLVKARMRSENAIARRLVLCPSARAKKLVDDAKAKDRPNQPGDFIYWTPAEDIKAANPESPEKTKMGTSGGISNVIPVQGLVDTREQDVSTSKVVDKHLIYRPGVGSDMALGPKLAAKTNKRTPKRASGAAGKRKREGPISKQVKESPAKRVPLTSDTNKHRVESEAAPQTYKPYTRCNGRGVSLRLVTTGLTRRNFGGHSMYFDPDETEDELYVDPDEAEDEM